VRIALKRRHISAFQGRQARLPTPIMGVLTHLYIAGANASAERSGIKAKRPTDVAIGFFSTVGREYAHDVYRGDREFVVMLPILPY